MASTFERPLRQFILKLHGRCNLACDYCYVYESIDKRWRTQPPSMSRRVIDHVVRRIAENARRYQPPDVDVVLHGGEPLLAGHEKIRYLLTTAHREISPVCPIRFGVQTNGLLLDNRYLDLFGEWNVRIGVSLDGDAAAHDRHRVSRNGSGSYESVVRVLRVVQASGLLSGLLCTVDLRNDPAGTYEALLDFRPPMVDFLLPHGNWSTPPPGRTSDPVLTPYADWLIAVFDRWYSAPERETRVRQFDEIINLLFGGSSLVEGIGLQAPPMIVVQTDGGIEHSDVLATTFEGAAVTNLNVERDSFDAVKALPIEPAAECERCSLYRICGGGLPAHRYREGAGFGSPSVYCADLYRLISHIRHQLATGLLAL